MTAYEAVIGLEIHIQLNTRSKIFCSCSADPWLAEPNTHICPVCTGHPGVLPVLNRAAVEKALRLALALGARVAPVSYFARKNYFYPDLPKGYQISQYDQPLATGGALPLEDGRHIRIHRLHLEEDAGKTRREAGRRYIDFNRCGVPLIELVTEPDLRSPEEAAQFLERLRQLVRWLDVSQGHMERGHIRCDVNVSVRPKGSTALGQKTEIKNVNLIDLMRPAVEQEIRRQIEVLEAGGEIEPWTLEWDEHARVLRKMRGKETEADYRYFREPDLLPLEIDRAWLEEMAASLPELPWERAKRFREEYGLTEYDARVLTGERALADYFEAAVQAYRGPAKAVANLVINQVLRLMNEQKLTWEDLRVTPARLAAMLQLVDAGVIHKNALKKLVPLVQARDQDPKAIVEAEGLAQMQDTAALEALCARIVAEHPEEAAKYRAGKTGLLGWFVGQVMRETRGRANPKEVQAILRRLLDG